MGRKNSKKQPTKNLEQVSNTPKISEFDELFMKLLK